MFCALRRKSGPAATGDGLRAACRESFQEKTRAGFKPEDEKSVGRVGDPASGEAM